MPALIPPDYTKADIPKLTSDMQKWYSVIPPSAKEWWESFLERVVDQPQVQDTEFPLYALKNHLQRPEAEENEAIEPNEQLKNLREKELAPLEEVI